MRQARISRRKRRRERRTEPPPFVARTIAGTEPVDELLARIAAVLGGE